MDPVSLTFILILLLGLTAAIYYIVVLADDNDNDTGDDDTGDDDDTNPDNVDDPSTNRQVNISLDPSTKTHLDSIYGSDVVTNAVQANNSDGAPSYYECTGYFQPFLDMCRKGDSIGCRWNWLYDSSDQNLIGPRCHVLTDKYNIKYSSGGSNIFSINKSASSGEFGINNLPNDNINGTLQIVPVTKSGDAVSATTTKKLIGSNRIACNDEAIDIETTDYDNL